MAEGNRLPALENAPHLKIDGEFFRIPPSPFSQRELHLSHQASLQWSLHPLRFPRSRWTETSGTRGCSWLRYSLRQSFGIISGAFAHKGLPMIVYAIELRVFVGNYFNDLIAVLIGHIRIYRHYHISLY